MVICFCSPEEMEQLVKMHGLSLYFLQFDDSSFNALEIVDNCSYFLYCFYYPRIKNSYVYKLVILSVQFFSDSSFPTKPWLNPEQNKFSKKLTYIGD